MREEFEEEVEKEELAAFGWSIRTTMFGIAVGDDSGKMEGEGAGAVGILAVQEPALGARG